MRIKLLLGIVATVALLAPAAPASAAPRQQRDDTGRLLQQQLAAMHAAGMPGVFAQIRAEGDAWNLAAGVADVDTGRPVRPQFRQRIGSITKTFVATTVLQLVGEHRVDLDAPIARYLPDVVPGELGRRVTVRMLLNHTSGIGDYAPVLFASPEAVEALRLRTIPPRELVRIGLSQPVTNAPGERWSYSNTNYIILGLLIERLSGRGYAQEVSRRILGPLGLEHSYFPGTSPYIRGPHMTGYAMMADGSLGNLTVFSPSSGWAAGEMISTAAEVNRFFRALLTGRLLSPALLAQMQTTVVVVPGQPEAAGWGLGILWLATPCGRVWGHTGGVVGYGTYTWHSADGRRQVTLAENLIEYAVPGQLHPIDHARDVFLTTAMCGPQAPVYHWPA
ncbi:MAG: beta-lactamase family protein [Actinobacteria bacterium]|nr:MAG: beta-lactamase family protein [Actinomycetota bacterium]